MKMSTIVVGFDGSDMAQLALDAAALLAEDGTVIHVVTASPPLDQRAKRRLAEVPEEFRINIDPHREAEAVLARGAGRLTEDGISTESHLVVGDPAGAILDIANRTGADLVVVGSRGLGRMTRFVRGSVSARVATHAPHSVLVVHHEDASESPGS